MKQKSPLLCNTLLPENLSNIDKNKDCDRVKHELVARGLYSLEEAERIVRERRDKEFEEIPSWVKSN